MRSYALDRIVATIDRVLMDPNTSEYLTDRAADILQGIHAGELS
ncbi:hypothetical protein FDG57_gp040 [Mycobacterium phage Mutaforma13]|uniref:Uncharacterized protein n=1 Tax=Mycobacterium phage Mutaforma13 TaxID=2922219 RepID=G1DUC8_9CAUD|nr:hypothetical protein FDG57_gp040 [Mycobacterium phage Mutaforma13]AEJ93186.1 hypothetical protein MUTAFORMA13_40 [Mycobacterium phage Mutaforma13]